MEVINPEFLALCIKQNQVSNLASNYDIACFSSKEDYHSNLYVVSRKYDIKYHCTTDCYIHRCALSDSGRFLFFQTANSPDAHRTDGNKRFFIDVINQKQLWSVPTETIFQSVKNYFIDERKNIIYENHGDFQVSYDFQGNFLNKIEWMEWVAEYPAHIRNPFYVLLSWACDLMQDSMMSGTERLHEKTIIKLIDSAIGTGISSEYQLGNAFKLLGDFYFCISEGEKALYAYRKGLQFYPKLPIKRIVKKLENSLGINPGDVRVVAKESPESNNAHNAPKEYLRTKWGTYEMPEPYAPKLTYGPRTDVERVDL